MVSVCRGEEVSRADDNQQGGTHYADRNLTPWQIIDADFNLEQRRGFYWGNILKYVLRYHDKDGIKDLKKARHYIDKLIELEEANESQRLPEASTTDGV